MNAHTRGAGSASFASPRGTGVINSDGVTRGGWLAALRVTLFLNLSHHSPARRALGGDVSGRPEIPLDREEGVRSQPIAFGNEVDVAARHLGRRPRGDAVQGARCVQPENEGV